MWGSGDFSLKQSLQNLLFPEGIIYDLPTCTYRTCRSNTVFSSIAGLSRLLGQKESVFLALNDEKSALVVWGVRDCPYLLFFPLLCFCTWP
jgi:hypothetical protein